MTRVRNSSNSSDLAMVNWHEFRTFFFDMQEISYAYYAYYLTNSNSS